MASIRSLESSQVTVWSSRRSLARHWWIVVIACALGVGSAAIFARNEPPAYRANTTLVVQPNDSLKETREIVDSLNTLDRRSVVATLAMVPASRTVRNRARDDLHLTEAQLKPYEVKTALVPDSNTIEVTVEGPDPRFAAAIANAVAEETISSTPDYYNIYAMKVLDWPVVPTEQVGPGLVRKLLVGGLLGILIGIGAALLLPVGPVFDSGARFSRWRRRAGREDRVSQAEKRRPSRVIQGVHIADVNSEPEGADEPASD